MAYSTTFLLSFGKVPGRPKLTELMCSFGPPQKPAESEEKILLDVDN